ncbi:DUF1631 family protein [Propionivibrio sp.]|uniref:DUF1631 family protein n=1 Tax=Propionivibrio sp. TaxID=2212460 RepID=UPI003BF3FC1E
MLEQSGPATAPQQAQEDSFFVLRDCSELFQRRLVEIARQSGISSPSVISAFVREVGSAHDELAASAQQDGFEQTAGLTASRITLVGNDDLELDIRIGEIASRLRSDERIDHWRVQLRYMTLLHRPKMAAESNPVGLEPICRGLWTICKESGDNLDQNLDRLDRLQEQLQEKLPEIYMELNELLESHRVEPAVVQFVQRASGGKPSAGTGAGGAGGTGRAGGSSSSDGGQAANALSTLQQTLRQQFAGEDLAPAETFSGNTTGNHADSSGNVILNASTIVMLNHLMERLRIFDLQQECGLSNFSFGESSADQPLRALKAKDLDLPLGKPAAIALDTLSLIFEGIFAAPDLPDAVKAAIGRLQIPLLKLAIIDDSFFADTQHPARRLVNRMARAAIGLAPDAGRDHPVCVSLAKLADAVRSTLEDNDGKIGPHLEQLDALIAERDQSIQANIQPYVQVVLEHEAGNAARSSAQDWLRKVLGQPMDPAIGKFLSDYWLRVMQAACLEGGTEGTRWKECHSTIEELLWSVQPKQTADERKQLVSLIPSLIKRINAGLDLLEISTEERVPFLNTCFDLQTAALRNRSAVPAPASAELPLANLMSDMAVPSVQILEHNGKLVQYLGLPSATQSPWRAAGNAWKVGDWISFFLPDGERLCGRYCWHGVPSGTVLLFNPDWGFAVALAPSLLEQQLRDSRARVVSESSLFDEAAEQALGRITLQ